MDELKELYLKTYYLVDTNSKEIDNFIILLKTIVSDQDLEQNIKQFCLFVKSINKKDFSLCLKKTLQKNLSEVEKEVLLELSKVKYEKLKSILIEKFKDYEKLLEKLPYYTNSGLRVEETKIDNRAFVFDSGLELNPVDFFDTTRFSDLKGYSEQKRILKENTFALLNDSKVNNILLYGDPGCGKSSSVRALLNEFQELRMVQIFKHNLINLDKLFEKLKDLPYKFVIFADDISFDESDRSLSTMKAALEGSLIQCPKNAVIYATSNRRHMVRESFKTRNGDEVHLNDTINEISSLSERFGINLLFSRPTNEEFNDIVLKLALDNNINIEQKELIKQAQRLALVKGSKSPRIARQFIDNLIAKVSV